MPSKSPAQARFMAAAAHDPAFARKAGVTMGVAKEFNDADAGRRQRKLAGALRAQAGNNARTGNPNGKEQDDV